MSISEAVAGELQAWALAQRAFKNAMAARAQDPEDPIVVARVERARAEQQEAKQLLKAALRVKGHSLADLQAELATR
ncbi:MAG: hypothetical protein AAGF11_32645 [Myxococcota bacterium]